MTTLFPKSLMRNIPNKSLMRNIPNMFFPAIMAAYMNKDQGTMITEYSIPLNQPTKDPKKIKG